MSNHMLSDEENSKLISPRDITLFYIRWSTFLEIQFQPLSNMFTIYLIEADDVTI